MPEPLVLYADAELVSPYAMSAFVDAAFMGEVPVSAPADFTMLVSSYQHAYGNIYSSTTDVFEARYATGIDSLLPTTTNLSTLYAQGRLPSSALFSSTPPAPEL